MNAKTFSISNLKDGNPRVYRSAQRLLACGWSDPITYVKGEDEVFRAGLSRSDLVELMGVNSPDASQIWNLIGRVTTSSRERLIAFDLQYQLVP